MKKRIAKKIFKAVMEYRSLYRYDMPYNGNQVWSAAKKIFIRGWPGIDAYKNWHKVSVQDGEKEINEILKKVNL